MSDNRCTSKATAVTDIIERAEAALDLWDRTCGVEIEIISGMVAAKDAYENAPEMVRDLVAELKAVTAERDKLSELFG